MPPAGAPANSTAAAMAGARSARGDVNGGSSNSTSSGGGNNNFRSNSGGFLSPKAGGALGRPPSSSHQPAGIADLAAAAREQMQQFFGRASASGTEPTASQQPQPAGSPAPHQQPPARSPSPGPVSPSNSLSEALQLDEEDSSLTFARAAAATPEPLHASQPQPETPRSALQPAATGSPGSDGPAVFGSPAAGEATLAGEDAVSLRSHGIAEAAAADVERSGASAAVDGLRQLLGDQERLSQAITAQQASIRKRTSAGLAAVDSLGPGSILVLLLVAVAALAWAHGASALQLAAWLISEHGSEVIAVVCLGIVALKAALAANLDTRLRSFLSSMDDMNASVKLVAVMQEDVHTMRVIIERMQADLDAKTAWIPTGIKPPAWLPRQR